MTLFQLSSLLFFVWTLPVTVTSFMMTATTRTSTTTTTTTTRLSVMRDEYLQPHFQTMTTTTTTTTTTPDVDRMVECASSDGLCDVEEMTSMLQDLETLHKGNNNNNNNDKERDEILKQALALQVELEQTRREMAKWGGMPRKKSSSSWATTTTTTNEEHAKDAFQDGSFDHFVNYRSMAEFESH